MTVAVETNTVSYNGDALVSEFDFAFRIFDESDLSVVYTDDDDNSYTLPSGIYSYTVSGELDKFDEGGTVSLLYDTGAALAAWKLPSGYSVTIALSLPYTQPTDLLYGGNYSAESIELMADRTVKMIQQLATLISACGTGTSSDPGEWGGPTAVTIASGIATLDESGYYSLNTEGLAATDALTQIKGLANGDQAILRPASSAYTITVTNGTYLKLNGGINFPLNNVYDRLVVQCVGSDTCVEISRSSGGS